MNRKMGIVGLLLAAALLAGGSLANEPQPGAAPPAPPAATAASPDQLIARGEEVYQQHCAMCHDNPTGRIPSRAFLRQARNADFILLALTRGAMRDVGAALPDHDKRAVATYLTGRPPRDTPEIDLAANMCTGEPPPMTLEGSWNGWGGAGVGNYRYQPEPGLSADDVRRLKPKWAFALPGGTYNQPVVAGGRVYVGNLAGVLYSLDAATGCTYWYRDFATPTRTAVVIGRMESGRWVAYASDWWGNLYALDAETGETIWTIRPDDHPAVRLTGTPVLHEGRLYVPISSGEEGMTPDPTYRCCTFRGKLVALDAETGEKIWTAYTIEREAAPVPGDPHRWGPAGAAIWSSPTIDAARGLVYVATGDDYTDPSTPQSDAIIALDLATGQKRWTRQVLEGDIYVGGCEGETDNPNCPEVLGPDLDFGASPLLFRTAGGSDMLVALSKGGIAFGMNPDTGEVVWEVRLGRGGMLGGIEWGGASDGTHVFVPISDYPYPGMDTGPIDGWELSPSFNTIEPGEGRILWRIPAPEVACSWEGACNHAHAAAPVAMPGVVFAGAWDGHERAYAIEDGTVLWDFDTAREFDAVNGATATGGSLDHGSHAVAGGTLFVVSGSRTGQRGNALIAFTVDGE